MLVHAPCEPGQKINEDWPLDPKRDYPRSKVQTEELIRAQRGDIPVVILRIAGVYDDRCHSIPLAHQIQRIFERKLTSHVFPGDISHGQAFLHLEDPLADRIPLLLVLFASGGLALPRGFGMASQDSREGFRRQIPAAGRDPLARLRTLEALAFPRRIDDARGSAQVLHGGTGRSARSDGGGPYDRGLIEAHIDPGRREPGSLSPGRRRANVPRNR